MADATTPTPAPAPTPETTTAGPAAEAAVVEVAAAPAAAALPDSVLWLERLLPKEAQPIFDLFDADFHTYEVWNAFEAVAVLGRKAEAFLTGSPGNLFGATGHEAMRAVVPGTAVTDQELCEQLRGALAAATPAPPLQGASPGAEQDAAVQMNPILAGLVVALAQRVANELIKRLGGWLNNR